MFFVKSEPTRSTRVCTVSIVVQYKYYKYYVHGVICDAIYAVSKKLDPVDMLA